MALRGAALVTGAGRRLGRAMALALARRGYDVAIHYHRSAEDAEGTAVDARALGVRAVTLGADLGAGRVEVVSGLAPGERLTRPGR